MTPLTNTKFGAGPRLCIGKNVAMMQAGKLLVELYRRFDAKLVSPGKEWHVNGGWICPQTDMDMIISLRADTKESIG